MTEMEVISVNEHLTTICIEEMGGTFKPQFTRVHTIWKVLLDDVEAEYALDLACAQFGHSDPAISWNEYTAFRCSEHKALPKGTVSTRAYQDDNFTTTTCQATFAITLLEALEGWDRNRVALGKMFSGPYKQYEANKLFLMSGIEAMRMGHLHNIMNPWISLPKNVCVHQTADREKSLKTQSPKENQLSFQIESPEDIYIHWRER